MRLRDVPRDRVAGLLTLIVLLFFVRPLTTATFYFRDLYRLIYPKHLFLAEALSRGELPLWDPMTHGGLPFLAVPSNFALHPANVLFAILPPLFALNLLLVLHVLFCALAAYWLARVLELSPAAAFVAGIGFACCGFTLSATNLAPAILGLPWIPMTIGLTHRAIRDRRSLFPAALAAAMPLYGAAAELTGMLFVLIAVWFLCGRYPRRQALPVVVLVIAGGVGLSLLQTLPATSVIEQSSRSLGRTYENFTTWSVAPQRLPELVVPRFMGNTDTLREEGYWGRAFEFGGYPYVISIYLGIPLLLLAACGASRHPALGILVLIALALSLGRHLPGFRLVYDHVPFVTMFRYPVKAQLLLLLPVAILAAFGVTVVETRSAARRLMMIGSAVAAVIAIVAAAMPDQVAAVFSFAALGPRERSQLALAFVHVAAVAIALAFAVRSGRVVAIAAVVALDLLLGGLHVNDFAPRDLFAPTELTRAARATIGSGRLYAPEKPLNVPAPDDDLMWLARWQIETLNSYNAPIFGMPAVYHEDYDGLAPVRMSRLSAVIARIPWERRKLLLDRANVTALVSPVAVPLPEVARLQTPAEPLRLYANRDAVPARFVSSVVVARDERDAARKLLAERDLSRVVLEGPPVAHGDCGSARVQWDGGRQYRVDAPCAGYVVFAENHYDGWSATVDGRPAPLVRADFAFTAVAVPAGVHAIERRYFPPRSRAGAAGSVAAAIVLLLVDRRRRITS